MSESQATLHYRALFDAFASAEGASDAQGLRALRQEAIESFSAHGFPTRKQEDWRYTNLRALEKADYAPAPNTAPPFDRRELDALLPDPSLGVRLVFVDGRFVAALSDSPSDAEVSVTLLRDVRGDDGALEAWLSAGDTSEADDAFSCLNSAFVEDGALVTVRRGAKADRPLHLVFVSSGDGIVAHPRVEIVAERDSEAVVIQDHVSLRRESGFTNSVTRIAVESGAQLHHVMLTRESAETTHVSNTRVNQARDSRFLSHVFTLSGGLVRCALEIRLDEPGAEAILDGAFLGGARQHVEHHTLVDHAAAHCESHELYKGVLGGAARGVFRGRVNVRPGAQKTNASQSNPNLLVTDRAEIDTKPQLEIRADDVKCNHGATIGRLDEDALFFLRARGLARADARALLTQGFAAEVTERLPGESLAHWVDGLVRTRLHADDGALAGEDS